VRKQYKPYNVIITETEPASGSYIEAVVGGTGSSTGWSASSGILGVAAADNFCGVTERGIAFSFSTNHRGIAKPNDELCATVAHEIGHLLALEHEIAAPDTMSYVPFASAGQKSFTSANSQCGTDPQNVYSCSCQTTGAGQVTSSGMRLTQFVGVRPMESTPPTLEIKSPGDDSRVRPTFTVTATAADETAMEQVAVFLDGMNVGASTTPDGTMYTIPLANVAEGSYTLEVQAIDLAGNVTKRQRAITVALGTLGESCGANEECSGQVCAEDSDGAFCTQVCDAANACPADSECKSAGDVSVCVPDSGGCSAGGAGNGGALVLLLGALAATRRRRRS
jgi:MYXO-CTERM domain-containing protein